MTVVAVADWRLRSAQPDDESLLIDICRSSRSDAAFVRCTDEEQQAIAAFERELQRQTIAAIYPAATTEVIVVEGHSAGQLIVVRDRKWMRLIDIALLPAFRGQGIGTAIVKSLSLEAASLGIPLSLRVAIDNDGARRLYQRLGFREVEEDGMHIEMELSPES